MRVCGRAWLGLRGSTSVAATTATYRPCHCCCPHPPLLLLLLPLLLPQGVGNVTDRRMINGSRLFSHCSRVTSVSAPNTLMLERLLPWDVLQAFKPEVHM